MKITSFRDSNIFRDSKPFLGGSTLYRDAPGTRMSERTSDVSYEYTVHSTQSTIVPVYR